MAYAIEGIVERLSQSEDEFGSMVVRHGKKPKGSERDSPSTEFPRTTHFDIPNDILGTYTIGQKVVVEIRAANAAPAKVVKKIGELKQRREGTQRA